MTCKAKGKGLFALCLLTFDLLAASCARVPVAVTPSRPADPLQQLRDDITAATTAPGVRRAAWGILVQSLDRGDRLFALNPGTLLVPASTVKLVSLASAVDAVGWGHQFETSFWITGPIITGVVHGDLIVTGAGDPSIGGRGGTDLMDWIQALRKSGVRRIEGRIIGDDNAIEESRPQLAWAWDDLGYATGAIFGALNYAENRMDVVIGPAPVPGGPTTLTVQPYAAYRPLDNRTVTGPPDSMLLLWPEQRPGVPFLTIAGSIPAGTSPARLQVSAGNPTFWFASVLRHALITGGIDVVGDAFDIDDVPPVIDRSRGAGIYRHVSRPLSELAQPMLKESINLYGEAVLRLNVPKGAFPTNDAALEGLRARMRGWGIADEAWQIVDGSGLSRRNAVAPEVLVAVLQRMYDPSGESPWMTALPVAGRHGTLETRMRGTAAEGTVRAKTGTMSNVRSLAGYVRTRDSETLAFAIMADGFEGPAAAAVEAIDRIAVRIAEFSRRP
jgi:D-alanyl-D-alanine carboxypeptidase/D-alanyl-D-alanine-endopeptidase (penicillin-binding protein 4)